MDLFIQGLVIGATLTVMIGPITFTILDASLTGGTRYGLMTALGMWSSDGLFIALCYFGARHMSETLQSAVARGWISLIGGGILVLIGVFIWITRNRQLTPITPHRLLHYSGHWFRGFMVNTFAPFSLIFWPSVTLGIVIPHAASDAHAMSFYAGVMLSIALGDSGKATFAGYLRSHISAGTTMRIRVALAVLFLLAGLYLWGHALYESWLQA